MAFVTNVPVPVRSKCASQWRKCACAGRSRVGDQLVTPTWRVRMQSVQPGRDESNSIDGQSSSSDGNGEYGATVVEAASGFVDTDSRDVPASDLKCELFAALASLNRGFAVPPNLRRTVESLIEQLERKNPTRNPSEKPTLFTGKWRLVYTNALDVLSLGLLSPIASVNQVYQNIFPPPVRSSSSVDFAVENVVEFEPSIAPVTNRFLGRSMTRLVVEATGSIKSSSVVGLTFENVSARPNFLFGYQFPSDVPIPKVPLSRPVGAIDTTFLDNDLRISRAKIMGRTDNVFVLLREL